MTSAIKKFRLAAPFSRTCIGVVFACVLKVVLAAVASMNLVDSANAQEAGRARSSLESVLKPLISGHKGEVAVAVRHLTTGESFSHRATEVMPTASLAKFPVMIEAYRQASEGKVNLQQMLTLKDDDKVQGSGVLTNHFSAGASLSLRDAIRLMIVYSDNTATNLVLDAIGLPATRDTMRQMGFPETQIHAKVFKRETSIAPERSEKYGLGSTTAQDMVELLARLHRGELVDRQASDTMLDHLLNCDDKTRFPALMPAAVKVAHKTGSVSRVRTDAGILIASSGAVALCVLTDKNEDTRWTDDNAANKLCANIAKVVYEHFFSADTVDKSTSPMRVGATGEMVESLQRTLNAQLAGATLLGVDGDFGPATEAAVKLFQRQSKLEPTGTVDAATWKMLGPLLTTDKPEPPPESINAEKLSSQPRDDPRGRPLVTCKAWTIADASTGQTLWNDRGSDALDIASTTKIMTAYIVLGLAAKDAKILDEMIEFSERADKTNGSTSGIRVGERLPIRELLYGLLLPSGNDAAVGLAEHFGERCATASKATGNSATPYDKFIAEMNRQAASLGMSNTHFENPHGLTAEKHKSTADDLAKLASAALQVPQFRDYVSRRQFACRVLGREGYERNVVWRNTNQLLEIEGYTGVKTGTTDAAGACLVASGKRGDRELLVIVLGSAASPTRYADSRNLFAWAWRQLEK